MTVRKTESFMRGALMLSLAALVVRLVGALNKLVLARIFAPFDGKAGAAGMGLATVPMPTSQVILSFTSVGLNVGISRLVAERMAVGDAAGARQVFRVALTFMTVMGFLAAVLLYLGAPLIAGAIGEKALQAVPGFRAMAPAVFFASMMAAYRGLFQGFQRMTPNAYSQMVEQAVRVVSGISLAYILVRYSVPLGAAGFNFGDVLGAVAGLLYLLWLVRRAGPGLWATDPLGPTVRPPNPSRPPGALPRRAENPWRLVGRIFAVSAPIAIAGAVVPLMMQVDAFVIYRSLGGLGLAEADVHAQYGLLTNAFFIAYLPAIFTTAIYTSILPSITEAVTLGQMDTARRRAIQAYRMTTLLSIPAQVGLYMLATGVYHLLFADVAGGPVMAAISWTVVPMMLQQTTAGVLQGMGRIVLPVRNFVIGAAIKTGLTIWWTPLWGIEGSAWATGVGFAVAALLNLIYGEVLLGRTLRTRSMILKPLAAALGMAGVIWLLEGPVSRVVPSLNLVTVLLIAAGGTVYGLVLLLVGGVSRQELEFIPRVGRPVADLLERSRLLR